ncbi:hypothetical protein DAEQUDRAFT_733673 [Daedalea quercina L-15889]|uniref:Uncharacterized protein n=1 Tax=Daedalea quercina L-15889 TaxID=1314783 RepID=A0A165KU06_9APHY|nr:hypothetical protein DAEQUDRAFT_733673 [Daedalea quercina L-15889]
MCSQYPSLRALFLPVSSSAAASASCDRKQHRDNLNLSGVSLICRRRLVGANHRLGVTSRRSATGVGEARGIVARYSA